MTALLLRRAAFAWVDSAPLLASIDLRLSPGWYGLVGANGAGKSTLLRLLAGELRPDEGDVLREPRDVRVVLCPQTVESESREVRSFAVSRDGEACRLRGALKLDARELDRWPTLSPGERKRWQIGAALAEAPGILLVDEPSNHLDAAARALLVRALAEHRGIGVVVSHDRALLDELTHATLRLRDGVLEERPGNLSSAQAAWALEARAADDARARARREEKTARARVQRAREEHDAAMGDTTRSRMKSTRDHDARGMSAKGRAQMGQARLGRLVAVRRGEAERAAENVTAGTRDRTIGRALFVGYEPAPSARVLALDAEEIVAGGRVLIRAPHVAVARDEHVWIRGENGAGKTTLVAAILARASLRSDRLLYVPQEIDAAAARGLVSEVRAMEREARGRTLQLVAALGVPPERVVASAQPSPGEARKLLIAMGLARRVWALVLDEPTNHLDLPAMEHLEEALAAFPGALLLVTHDDAFARACTTTTWTVARGEVRVTSTA